MTSTNGTVSSRKNIGLLTLVVGLLLPLLLYWLWIFLGDRLLAFGRFKFISFVLEFKDCKILILVNLAHVLESWGHYLCTQQIQGSLVIGT